MQVQIEFNDRQFVSNMARMAAYSRREIGEVLREQARGYVRRVVGMTPPQGASVKGGAAKKALEGRILSDLNGLFAPVRLKGKRPEAHPDLLSIFHAQRLLTHKSPVRRAGASPRYYVDQRKFRRLHRDLKLHVGRLAAGWNAAGDKLAVPRPAWIRRHSRGEGYATIRLGEQAQIEVANTVPYANAAHLDRMSRMALYYQERALARALPHVLRKMLRQSRLSA